MRGKIARMPDEWINAEDAGRILRVSSRMVYRYAEGDAPQIRSMRAGRRILFNRADVEAYAEETAAENRPKTQPDTVRADELLDMVREQQRQLMAASAEIGGLKEQLKLRLLPGDVDGLKERIHTLEREKDKLEWDQKRLLERIAAYEEQEAKQPPPQPESPQESPPAPAPRKLTWRERFFGS